MKGIDRMTEGELKGGPEVRPVEAIGQVAQPGGTIEGCRLSIFQLLIDSCNLENLSSYQQRFKKK